MRAPWSEGAVPRSCGYNSLPSTLSYGQPESRSGESAESNESQNILIGYIILFPIRYNTLPITHKSRIKTEGGRGGGVGTFLIETEPRFFFKMKNSHTPQSPRYEHER